MKYDEEYNSYKFNTKDMDLILDALSYVLWNDKSLSKPDRDYILMVFINLWTIAQQD